MTYKTKFYSALWSFENKVAGGESTDSRPQVALERTEIQKNILSKSRQEVLTQFWVRVPA